ncbi:hypothetical protein MOO44_04640 [Nicoliella spurrieriana]|uniref:Uncharacterized protein n=1 Tax=Nicoliella spurrieriana TaxID=2925830 RepID=A0A976RTA9_9LACO|nr:hypothetical protein [Nicoliella spurrieriana]UQS87446.1 hypothetical protein MOO44_04640 [Nicoliella spurrieriana]
MSEKKYAAKEVEHRLNDVKKSAKEDTITPTDGWNTLLNLAETIDHSESKAEDYRKTLVELLSKKDSRGFLLYGTGKEVKQAVNDSKDYKDIDVDGLNDVDAYELDEKKNEYKPLAKDSVEGVVDKVLK